MKSCCRILLTSLVFAWFTAHAYSAQEWPQFRGPHGNGISEAVDVPLEWSETRNVAWRTAVPGKGWSSPVVRDGLAWMTTAVENHLSPKEVEEALANLPAREAKSRQVLRSVSLKAVCIDLKSGERVKTVDLFEVEDPDPIHTLNSYSSPTPVLESDRIYCHFGTFGTASVDTKSGDIVWKKRLPLEHSVGPGSSPFVHDNLLILICDGVDVQYVTALDKSTGEAVWKTDRPEMRAEKGDQKKAYSTPIAINHGGRDQIICMGSQWLISYDPATGKEWWRVDHGKGFSVVPRPVFDPGSGTVFVGTGFGSGELWAVRVDGKGDVSDTHVVWKATRQIPTRPSPLLHDGKIYVVSDGGIASCFDAAGGDLLWAERLGGNFSASPVFADGKIYFCSHEGQITIIAPGDEYRELAVNEIEGQIMASPVPLDGALLIRTDQALYRIRG